MAKMTKREMFNQIMAHTTDEAEKEFLAHELELLEKKNASDKKPTKKQEANSDVKATMLTEMEPGKLYTVTDMLKNLPSLAGDADMTNQKISALVRQMVADGLLTRTEDKRKAYFSLPTAE